jgi:DNA-binding transcriptional MerR regulator
MSSFKQLASLLNISDRQLRRYAEAGKIIGAYTTKGGHWRLRGQLTNARVERARKILRLNPSIALSRRREHLKRANDVIKDVQKHWKQTFTPVKKKSSKAGRTKSGGTSVKDETPVQGDLFGNW